MTRTDILPLIATTIAAWTILGAVSLILWII